MLVNPYLFFNGDCTAAFKLYEKVLGAKIETLLRYEETPGKADVPAEWLDKIIHGRIALGDQVIMASDAPPGLYSTPQGFYVSYDIGTPAEAERIFAALSEGGTVRAPMEETFFAHRFGMLVDRFGTPWMIVCSKTE